MHSLRNGLAGLLIAVGFGGAPAMAQDIPALLHGGKLAGREMVFAGWGGVQSAATMENFVVPFQAETGVKVTMISPGGAFAPKLAAQAQAGQVQWDLIDGPGSEGDIMDSRSLLQNFPQSLLDALKPLVRPTEMMEPWRLRYGQAPYVLVCNAAIIQHCPTTPQEFWDVANFPGPRGLAVSSPVKLMTFAALATGTPRDKLFPLNIPAAEAALKAIKPQITVWANSPAQSEQVIANGEVGMELISNGRANHLLKAIPGLRISWQGAVEDPDGWVVPKGAKNADVAFAFLLWVAEHPKNQAGWTATMFNATPALTLHDLIPPDVLARTAVGNDPVRIPHEVVVNQQIEIRDAMQRVLAGG